MSFLSDVGWSYLSKLLVDNSNLVCLGHWVLVKLSDKLRALNYFLWLLTNRQFNYGHKVV